MKRMICEVCKKKKKQLTYFMGFKMCQRCLIEKQGDRYKREGE